MALSRTEVTAKSMESIEGEVQALEASIDLWLVTRLDIGKRLYDVRGIPWAVREEVERRYRAVGWSVTFYSDQRDGDYLEFE